MKDVILIHDKMMSASRWVVPSRNGISKYFMIEKEALGHIWRDAVNLMDTSVI